MEKSVVPQRRVCMSVPVFNLHLPLDCIKSLNEKTCRAKPLYIQQP